MANEEERIEEALDTLSKIQKLSDEEAGRDIWYQKRTAAEEVLRHYREARFFKEINIVVNGAVPVRPMTRAEMEG